MGLQPAAEIVGGNDICEVCFELAMIVIVEALDGRFLGGAVHPLDLPASPGMLHLGEAMLDAILVAPHVEYVGDVASCRPVGVTEGRD